MERPVEERLLDSAKAIKDDIRGAFKGLPEYRDHLHKLLTEAAAEIEDLRQLIPAPAPE